MLDIFSKPGEPHPYIFVVNALNMLNVNTAGQKGGWENQLVHLQQSCVDHIHRTQHNVQPWNYIVHVGIPPPPPSLGQKSEKGGDQYIVYSAIQLVAFILL